MSSAVKSLGISRLVGVLNFFFFEICVLIRLNLRRLDPRRFVRAGSGGVG